MTGLVAIPLVAFETAAQQEDTWVGCLGRLIHIHYPGRECIDGLEKEVIVVLRREEWENAARLAREQGAGDEHIIVTEVAWESLRIRPEDRQELLDEALKEPSAPAPTPSASEFGKLWDEA